MPATLTDVVNVRSQLVREVLRYLDTLATDMAVLPAYYPAHLRTDATGTTRFDAIRQLVQVVQDRSVFEQWLAAERERLRAAGQNVDDRRAYAPFRARPEHEDAEHKAPDAPQPDRPAPPPPVPWDEHAGTRFTRAIILGDPGFGKTWLLRYEARRLAREGAQGLRARTLALSDLVLPIFVRLSEVNQYDDPLEDTLVALAGTGYSEAFRRFVRARLSTPHCALLLDAWDEVPVEIPPFGQPVAYLPHFRQRLGQRLAAFALQCPDPRLLITSRIVGYTASLVPKMQELELLAFDTRYMEAFARVWFGDDDNEDNSTRAQPFLALIREHPRVRGLARIPLMLALLCRTYQETPLAFPTRRVDLYQRCVRGLLRDWQRDQDKWQGDHGTGEISDAYVDAIIELLQDVACALFNEGYQEFSESLLRRTIKVWLDSVKHTHELAERTPTGLIAELKGNGVLITSGSHRDAPLLFLHLTFQEYLTACALARQAHMEGWEAIAPLVNEKAGVPAWQEVIILLAGILTEPTLLLKLLTRKQKDDYFRHRLALAALSLPELPSDVREEQAQVINVITTTSFSLWWKYHREHIGAAVPHLTRMLPALVQINGYMEGTPLLAWCCRRLHDPDWIVRRSAAEALGQLGEVAARHPDVLPALLATLYDGDWIVCCSAAEALGQLGEVAARHPDVLPALLAALHTADYWIVRRSAAEALGQLGEVAARHPDVLPALLVLLAALHDRNESTRCSAADVLGRLGEVAARHPDVLPALLAALRDANADVRHSAAQALGRLGEVATRHPDVLPALLAALRDANADVRHSAAQALGQLGEVAARHPDVLPTLLAALRDANADVRRSAAEALGQLGEVAARHPDVLPALLVLLAALHDRNESTRCSAADVLGQLGEVAARHPDVLPALLAALHDADAAMHVFAAQALGRLGDVAARHPDVLPALLAALHDADAAVRVCAAQALEQLGEVAARHPDVLPTLLAALRDANADVRACAAQALGRLGEVAARHPDVLPALLAALHDGTTAVRVCAAQALGQFEERGIRFVRSAWRKWRGHSVTELSQ